MTPVRRVDAPVAWIVVLVLLTSVGVATIGGRAGVRAQAPSARLQLVAQQFAVAPNGDVRLEYLVTGLVGDPLELIPALPETVVIPPDTVATLDTVDPAVPTTTVPEVTVTPPVRITAEVTNYAPLTDPDDVAGLVGSEVDPDAFSAVGPAIDGVAIDLRPVATRNDDGTVSITLDIGTDVVDSVESRLKLARPGLYPLRVELLIGNPADGVVIATAGTVVQRLPAPDGGVVTPPIDLSVVAVVQSPPPDADPEVMAAANDELDQALDLAATLTSPVTLEVPPALIAAVAGTSGGPERLDAALTGDELVALPLVPLDVSAAVGADRADAFTRLVLAGVDMLTDAAPTVPSRRDVWVTTAPLSGDGAQLLRDLGTRYVIVPAALYESSIDSDLPATDRFVDAALPDGGVMPLLVVDPRNDELTVTAADEILLDATATEWSVRTLSEMLVEQQVDDATLVGNGGTPARRSRILTTPDLLAPDARLMRALEQLAATTSAVRFAPASTLTGVTDVQLERGMPLSVDLPDVAGPSLSARIERIDSASVVMASAASMLPAGDPRPTEWANELDSLISTGYTDADVETATAALVAEADALTGAVQVPEPFTFTLTGRRGTIEIRIGNTSDEPLRVKLVLDSSKLTFPEGDQEVTLRPMDETSVIVPVTAESNGTSSIDLVVSTPAGQNLGDPVSLTARVTALTGLGQVLTGGFLLVLLTWWFTNARTRRRAALEAGREHHPSTAEVESGAL